MSYVVLFKIYSEIMYLCNLKEQVVLENYLLLCYYINVKREEN